ncbi:23S rRNA (guanosine(2251)-2'-O)-methyltransferase RlmB [Govanella unica]|uniref:23S rRNA (Guanosine(2251)-2'-O)-methyltransferase RlmB n=1 Tax=Govanella unica TaxID=2975056 RepID=A0A9X3TVZ9_9PROT|nr:23S rRNA (guanosine(2251)-2'-O)-methyltransferase RlmB [Govania unica]MDA5193040.1 23S rRNA (guanosine(2251)-2'-O)-methyltransferase RlmB [Govania unica]
MTKSDRPQQGRRPKHGPRLEKSRPDGRLWLFGHHAVTAALLNPRRMSRELRCTRTALEALAPEVQEILQERRLVPVIMNGEALTPLAPPGSVHQGIFLAVEPLDDLGLEDIDSAQDRDSPSLVVFLDQVTDPHNVGAILRSAAAFGAAAVITQDRHAPPESAVIAKAASGALETVPWVRVVNLSRALDELAELGFWRIGLDGSADKALPAIDLGQRIALVLGAEGAGLRHGTREHCDVLAKLPITSAVESLNVSNAAAVALYEFARRSI